eukprot:EG_transcript_57670
MDPARKAALDNRANQFNPNHPEYRGGTTRYTGDRSQAALDNHANQLNPNHPSYRGPRDENNTQPPSMDPARKAALDNRANQFNPNHPEYRGGTTRYTGDRSQAALDNHA